MLTVKTKGNMTNKINVFAPTGQCTGIGVKEVGDDAARWDPRLRGNRRIEGKTPRSTSDLSKVFVQIL